MLVIVVIVKKLNVKSSGELRKVCATLNLRIGRLYLVAGEWVRNLNTKLEKIIDNEIKNDAKMFNNP